MADKKDDSGLALAVGLVITAAIAVEKAAQVAGPIIKPIVEKTGDAIDSKMTQLKNRITLPGIPSLNSRIMLDDTKQLITSLGLPVSQSIVKANKLYKDCLEFEVVGMDHKPKQKVNPGTPIVLYYVTSDIIIKSQQLYEDFETIKKEKKQKRDEIFAKTQQRLTDTTERTKNGVKRLVSKKIKASDDILLTIEDVEDDHVNPATPIMRKDD